MSWSSRSALLGATLLAACEPIVLVAEVAPPADAALPRTPLQAAADDMVAVRTASTAGQPSVSVDSDPSPASATRNDDLHVELTFKSIDCGSCIDITASAVGGVPPYQYEWDDGTREPSRRLCVGESEQVVSVTAEDASGDRSSLRVASLQPSAANANGCPSVEAPAALCLANPSFEGTAALNTGQLFDAKPWSDCVDATAVVANTPDIASDALDPVTGIAPAPTNGSTYLAMIAGEQASQALCEALPAGTETSLRLDAMRFDLGGPDVYLQIWGGDAASCAPGQLLWTSPALQTTWQNYCVTLAPSDTTDQLTLRAEAPMQVPTLMTTYLAVDNIVAADSCP